MSNESRDAFKLKVLTSFVLTFSFFVASISGIVLYLAPKGRIAHWIQWSVWNLDKEQWAALHMSFVTIMLVSGLLHLFWFNWSSFWGYIRSRKTKLFRHQIELGIAIGLIIFFWVGTVYQLPPAISINNFAEAIDASYENQQNEPPEPHAEEWTLVRLAEQYNELSTVDVIERLLTAGITVKDSLQTLGGLAAANMLSPRDLLDVVATDSELTKNPDAPVSYHTAGQGRMSVSEYCDLKELDLETSLEHLRRAGYADVRSDRILKEYAAEAGRMPSDVAKILQEGPDGQ